MKPRIALPVPHSSDREYVEQALPQFRHAIEAAGGKVVLIPLDKTQDEIAQLLKQSSGMILPGSPADLDPEKYGARKHPKTHPPDAARDAADELLLQDAYNMRKPLLGVCYGLQALNVWRSGTLRQHLETEVRHDAERRTQRAHKVNVDPDSRLAHILSEAPHTDLNLSPDFTAMQMTVNSSHHQAAKKVGDGLRVAARSSDDRVIEALEGKDPEHFVLAVQWHPERSFAEDAASRALFAALIEAARRWKQSDRAQGEPESLER
ncbi:MAG: gamma-glutamyl-gamma-aminobutyrate hydrolase family protein [Terriglobales bacterium]